MNGIPMQKSIIVVLFAALLVVESVSAVQTQTDLGIHPLFSDHGVLQSGMTVPIWGTAQPDQKVQVRFANQQKETVADAKGNWMVNLDSLPINKNGQSLTVRTETESLAVNDLLVGEVWLCSGQSNMAFALQKSDNFGSIQKEIKESNYDSLRIFKVPVAGSDQPETMIDAKWETITEQSAARFSATAFYFGRALAKGRNVPVGLIQSANGGTNAYSWINSDTLENDPVAETTRALWATTVAKEDKALEKFAKQKIEWAAKVKAARGTGKRPKGRAPREPLNSKHVKRPTGHYNAMIAPLQPYALRGVIWYQGEANSRPPFCTGYKDLMLALVEDWRSDWAKNTGQANDFHFFLVQLPNYAKGHPNGWPIIREQMQMFGQEGKNTGAVTTIDVGDANDIHPSNKMPIGERLAKMARMKTYDETICGSGPVFESFQVKSSGRIELTFQTFGSELKSSDGKPLRFFEMAGDDRKFKPAQATIQDNCVIVTCDEITEPVAVRYAWTNNPENPNFTNEEGWPASPFRTDDWEIELD